MEPSLIDGNANLSTQQDTLNTTENIAAVKTVTYKLADPASSHKNVATFEDVTQTEILPPITLVEVTNGEPDDAIFVSDVWVSGKVKKVAGIRKG
jgi:hypothetical protein